MDETEYRKFVQSVIDNVKKNGFPDKHVAFPLEQLYEAAEKKGISFNKVLVTLEEIEICHRKTPEKIIFFPKKDAPPPPADSGSGAGIPGFDPSLLGNMNLEEMMAAASQMMENMTPEQMEAAKSMYENMSEEQKNALIEQIKKMGGS